VLNFYEGYNNLFSKKRVNGNGGLLAGLIQRRQLKVIRIVGVEGGGAAFSRTSHWKYFGYA
jgi:hypothetical protein